MKCLSRWQAARGALQRSGWVVEGWGKRREGKVGPWRALPSRSLQRTSHTPRSRCRPSVLALRVLFCWAPKSLAPSPTLSMGAFQPHCHAPSSACYLPSSKPSLPRVWFSLAPSVGGFEPSASAQFGVQALESGRLAWDSGPGPALNEWPGTNPPP